MINDQKLQTQQLLNSTIEAQVSNDWNLLNCELF